MGWKAILFKWCILVTRNQRRKEMWALVQTYKQKKGCRECGYNKSAHALQFDHLRDKKANVSDLIRSDYGIKTIWEEIGKCQVLCANCHAETTHTRKTNPGP